MLLLPYEYGTVLRFRYRHYTSLIEYFIRPSKTFSPVEFGDVKVVLLIVDAIFATDTICALLLDRLLLIQGRNRCIEA
uniref:Uncharacterized protein n=1 Tax=Acrobeloides nanus TaxID=290746 RepID=A0A914DV36_9BILA